MQVASAGSSRYFRAVALDFDGTVAEGGPPAEQVLEAIATARRQGLRVVLVTGRILAELREVFPDVDQRVDVIVGENGAVVAQSGRERTMSDPVDGRLADALVRRGVSARRGRAIVACSGSDEILVLQEVRALGLDVQLVRNRGELMVLPAGVSKGAGLIDALAAIGLSTHNTIAVGDAENDLSLFRVSELGVAVANAVDSVKASADIVLEAPDGDGVVALLEGDLLAGRDHLAGRRWRIDLGIDDRGEPVEIPSSQLNLLVVGDTGSGKSHLVGAIAEQLVEFGYATLIIDPEGDHTGLSELRSTLVISSDDLPAPSVLVQLLGHRHATVVDLSGLDDQEREDYLLALPPELKANRARTGLPQWIVLDEAHAALPRGVDPRSSFGLAGKGWCLVTWRPQDLSAEAIASIDAVVALCDPGQAHALVDIAAAVGDVPRAAVAELLSGPRGRAVLTTRLDPGRARRFTVIGRTTSQTRHARRYERGGLEPERRFHFRAQPDLPTGFVAGGVGDLEEILGQCPRSVLRHHCPGNDLSRWIDEVLHDASLAEQVAEVERTVLATSPAAVVEAARVALLAILQNRLHK